MILFSSGSIIDILRKKPEDFETKRRCVSIMRENGTLDYCLSILKEVVCELRLESKRIGPNPFFDKYFFEQFDMNMSCYINQK